MSGQISVPRHIAIIMDGNGRWAKARGMPRMFGHKAGVENVRRTLKECVRQHVEALTLYAFSTENWIRPADEVGALMRLFVEAMEKEIDEVSQNNVRVRLIGDFNGLPKPVRDAALRAMDKTASNTGLLFQTAINYGGRAELLSAAKSLCASVAAGEISLDEVTRDAFESRLYTAGAPDVDLLIRTSGEMRLSNFLPYQTAYSEMIFVEKYWPDFNEADLQTAIAEFARRKRRFGGV